MAGTTVGVTIEVQGADAFFNIMRDADKVIINFAQSTGNAGGTVSSAGQVMIGALRQVGTVAIEAAAAGAKAIGAFAADAVTQAGDFESGLLRFGSVVGSSITEAGMSVDDFSALFLKLGADTQYSAAQAEEAAINLAKGGLDPATISSGALADTLTLASAGELDLATAADITAKQLGVWANTGVTSADVANLLAQSANASVVSVEELALGMANVGGVAKLAGASFQDTVTALGAVSAGFSSASDAGTSMKSFLQKLQPTTKPAIAAFKELGLATADGSSKFYDAQGNFVGFSQAAELLKGSLAGLTKAQQQQALTTIFGADGIRVAALLAEKGAAGFDAFAASMGATGSAAEQATAKNQGFNFALEAMKGSIDTLKIVLGTALLPLLTTLLNDIITPGINTLTEFGSSFSKLIPSILASSDPLNTFFNALRISLPEAIPMINAVQTAFAQVAGAIQPAIPVILAFGQAFMTAVAAIPGIVASIGAAVQTLAAPWIAAFQSIAPAVQTALGTISSIVTSVITTIQGTSAAQLASMHASFMTAWTAIATTTGQVWNSILGIINPILAAIAAFVAANGADIRNTFVTVWTQVNGIITSAMQLIQATVVPALQAIGGFISNHGAEIQAILTSAWTIIKTIITATLSTVQGLITAALAAINGDWTGAWAALVGVANTQVSAIITIFTEFGKMAVAQIALAMDGSYKKLMSYVGPFTQVGADLVAGIAQGILNGANAVVNATGKVILDGINAAKNALSAKSPSQRTADEIGLPFSQGIAQGILTGLPVIQTVAAGISTAMVQTAAGIVAGIKTSTAQAGSAVVSGIEQKADAAQDAGGDLSSGLAQGIKDGKSGVISAAIAVANSAIEAAKNALAIGSPSRKSAQEVGVPFITGIVKGMDDSFGMLQSMAKVLGKNLTDVMKNVALAAVKGFREVLEQGLQAQISLQSQDIENIDAISGIAGDTKAATKAKADYAKALNDRTKADQDYANERTAADDQYAQDRINSQADLVAKMSDLRQKQSDLAAGGDARDLAAERDAKIQEVKDTTDFEASKQQKIADIMASYAPKFAKIADDNASKLIEINKQIQAAQAEGDTRLAKIDADYLAGKTKAYLDFQTQQASDLAEIAQLQTEATRLQDLQTTRAKIAADAQAKLDAASTAAEETRKTNATAAAAQFDLASKQILAMAGLQADLAQAQSEGDAAEVAALQEKITITGQLQKAQQDLLTQQLAGVTGSPLDDTLKQLTDLQTALQREVQLDKQRAKDTSDRRKRAEREAEAAQSQVALDKINNLISQVQQGVGVGTSAAITATLQTAMEQAVAQAQQTLGIHSPSTVAQDKIGVPFGAGIVAGIGDALRTQLPAIMAQGLAMPQASMPAQTVRPPAAAPNGGNSYANSSTVNAPVSIYSNANLAQIETVVNRCLDRRTNRANGIKATGGYS